MPAGVGGMGYVAIVPEATMGTYLHPGTAGAQFVPILDENLAYTEEKYMSRQIRQQTIVSEVMPSYYHVEGDITMEVDPKFFPYFMHASRHNIAKSGAGPFTYTYSPSNAGSATTAATGNVPRTLSITVVRNGIGFGYGGCVVSRIELTVEDGTLRATLGIQGLSEATPGALGSPAWVAANLYGADTHKVYVDAAGTAPTFASASNDFNGITFTVDHNAEAQNRIMATRAASYISYGETEITYETELDFVSKTEYDNFKAVTTRAVKLESLHPAASANLTAATDGINFQTNRSVYETYDVSLGAMEDLIMAGVTGRGVGIAGGNAYELRIKTATDIT